MNLNKVFIIGRLTGDPQLRQTPSGQNVASFSIATNRVWTDKAGAKQEAVEFHNIVLWGRQAEVASQYLTKGQVAFIEGRLQTRSWEGKDGHKNRTTEIVGERMQLGQRAGGGGGPAMSHGGGAPGPKKELDELEAVPTIDIDEGNINPDEIPF
jgi:single-strand DNA-binding protein